MKYIKITKNDIANGIGIRTVLWVSGCTLHCKNCHNPQTHDFNNGVEFTEDTMQEILEQLNNPYVSGLTLSGGHPLEHKNINDSNGIYNIVRRVRMVFPNKTIWVYSGFTWEQLLEQNKLNQDDNYSALDVLKYCDVLVDGAYIDELKDISLQFRGSKNQRIIDIKKSFAENKIILWQE